MRTLREAIELAGLVGGHDELAGSAGRAPKQRGRLDVDEISLAQVSTHIVHKFGASE